MSASNSTRPSSWMPGRWRRQRLRRPDTSETAGKVHRMNLSGVLRATVVFCALSLCAAPSRAHHSFAAEFDGRNCREFIGILTKLDWQSPHPYFYMDVRDASGKVQNWSFQTYAPITLRRAGN